MSSGMFRDKESSNRIKLLVFWAPCSSGQGAGVWWGIWGHLGAWGMSLHMCTCTCMHTHVYMYRNCKWPLTWRHLCLSCLTCMCVCVCICMHACVCMVHGAPSTHPHSPQTNPPTCHPPRGIPRISQNSITHELIKIIQFCLKV